MTLTRFCEPRAIGSLQWLHEENAIDRSHNQRSCQAKLAMLIGKLKPTANILRLLVVIPTILFLNSCNTTLVSTSIDRSAAQKISDLFMAKIVADRVEDALGLMEPEFLQYGSTAQLATGMRGLFDYCGRPLDSEFKHDELGSKLYPDGRKKPLRKFYYAATTTRHLKGECFFSVEVVPSGNELKVTSFGPLKLMSGQLPPWLH